MKINKLLKLKKTKKQKFSSEIELKGLQVEIRQRPQMAIELLKAAKAKHSHWADHQHEGRW